MIFKRRVFFGIAIVVQALSVPCGYAMNQSQYLSENENDERTNLLNQCDKLGIYFLHPQNETLSSLRCHVKFRQESKTRKDMLQPMVNDPLFFTFIKENSTDIESMLSQYVTCKNQKGELDSHGIHQAFNIQQPYDELSEPYAVPTIELRKLYVRYHEWKKVQKK